MQGTRLLVFKDTDELRQKQGKQAKTLKRLRMC